MQKGDGYTLFFAAAVCVVCSVLLAGTSAALKQRQDAQIELDRKLNVLKAFGVAIKNDQGDKLGEAEVNRMFADHIREISVDPATGKEGVDGAPTSLPLYLWEENGATAKYAFPISGKGLWSTIYGYMALDRDLSSIVGVTFYRHGETPGLGGEIERDWFQDQFKGKKVFSGGALRRLDIVKGKVADKYPQGNDSAVDGISGATLTGAGVARFMNADLAKYESYFSSVR